MTEPTGFEPDITAFMCMYCAAASADAAGMARITYPANVKVIRLPCTGKVDVRYILKAFEQGADGVYIVACPIGNCHHQSGTGSAGNVRASKRVAYAQKLLDDIGLGGGRLNMYTVTAGDGQSFAHAAIEMTERVQQLGPNPIQRQKVVAQPALVE